MVAGKGGKPEPDARTARGQDHGTVIEREKVRGYCPCAGREERAPAAAARLRQRRPVAGVALDAKDTQQAIVMPWQLHHRGSGCGCGNAQEISWALSVEIPLPARVCRGWTCYFHSGIAAGTAHLCRCQCPKLAAAVGSAIHACIMHHEDDSYPVIQGHMIRNACAKNITIGIWKRGKNAGMRSVQFS